MDNNYTLLSSPMQKDMPLFRGGEPMVIRQVRSIESGDSCNTAVVSVFNHAGTHVDVPNHFYKDGKAITDYSINDFIFNSPLVIECPKNDDELISIDDLKTLKQCDILLLKTGFAQHRNDVKRYSEHNPGLSPEAADHIRKNYPGIRAIGIDAISIAAATKSPEGRKTHQILLNPEKGRPVFIIEDMYISDDLHEVSSVYVIPFFIEGIDSSPCTVFGEVRL